MGERAKQESWQGKGMEGKCLGSMRKTAETGNVSPGPDCPSGFFLDWFLTWFLPP